MRWYLECLKKYATFRGRARRKEYWMFVLVNTIVFIALTVIEAVAKGEANSGSVLASLYNFAVLLPGLAAAVRRMHDTDRSGWWILVPIVGLVFLCTDGDHGDNRFGPDPKAIGVNAEASGLAAA